jgi:cob(I)alamin adenosyltransferase
MRFKIYTKTGDDGDTSLACGSRLGKDDVRVEAYGNIDELSSVLGVVSSLLMKPKRVQRSMWSQQKELMEWVQEKLFTLSSMLACVNLPSGRNPEVEIADIELLERCIDEMETELPELRNFILPGGSELVSFIHLARTVCRRSERSCTSLDRQQKLHPVILPFLNRLSDFLFVFGRWCAYQLGEPEKIWLGRKFPDVKRRVMSQQALAEKLSGNDVTEQLTLFTEASSDIAETP